MQYSHATSSMTRKGLPGILNSVVVLVLLFGLAACGGGSSGGGGTAPTYTIGGTVTGLAGSGLVLQNNGGDNLSISTNGGFTFSTPLASGSSYNVTVLTQPSSPAQVCHVTSGASGTVGSANIATVTVTCVTNAYSIGGTVSGLSGTGLKLLNNGGDQLTISANGSFTFSTPLLSGSGYNVTVLTQPSSPPQTCTVTNGSGTASANVTSVNVNCGTNAYTVGGMVSGLAGTGLVLRNNGGNNLSISANGSFTFSTPILSGGGYNVTVLTQPTSPSQTCTVTSGSGTVGSANVTSVSVNCTTNTYTIGGTVTGLAGTGLVLQNNSGNNLSVSGSPFTFSTALLSGSAYNVTVLTQPTSPSQTCTVTSGSGTVGSANVTSVSVNCVTNTYTIGGTLTGLAGGASVVLQNNSTNNLTISANGGFNFTAPIASGSAYNVTVLTQPSSPVAQTCHVTSGATGTVGSTNVVTVVVECVTNTYSIGGTVTGLAGTGLVLQNNSGNDLTISANGTFTFSTQLSSGSGYSVTVKPGAQPAAPTQTCTVTNGSGTANANVTNVSVNCVTNTYTIGGNVTGLAGTGLVLRNNAGNDLSIGANGSFTFTTPIASGSGYNVTVFTQPSSPAQTCTVTSGSGTVGSANVTNVSVSCGTTYKIGGNVTGFNGGTGLVLQNNLGDNLAISDNGTFTFATAIVNGASYSVTTLANPTFPPQTCTVTGGATGTVSSADVTNVAVSCGPWTRQLGSAPAATPDVVNDDFGLATATDAGGNIYVTGYTQGDLPGAANPDSSHIFSAYFVVKYDKYGKKIWTREFGSDIAPQGHLLGQAIATDSSGNVYVAGTTLGNMDNIALTGIRDLFVVKFNSDGVRQWTRLRGAATVTTFAYGIAISGTNVYVAGTTDGSLDGQTSIGLNDMYIVKYDTNGTWAWTRQFGTAFDDGPPTLGANGNIVATDPSGNVYVTGSTYGDAIASADSVINPVNADATHLTRDIIVASYTASGAQLWTRQFGTGVEDMGSGIATDASGNVYVTGQTSGNLDGAHPSPPPPDEHTWDVYVAKFSSTGTSVKVQQFDYGGADIGYSIATDATGIYVVGTTYNNAYDLLVMKLDAAELASVWKQSLGTTGDDKGFGIAINTTDHAVYAVGWTEGGLDGNANAGTDYLTPPPGLQDIFVVKYSTAGNKQ